MTNLVRATIRLQFHKDFTLHDAVDLVPYFAQLGISHIYSSPLLAARPGSTHCYDTVDPTRINPEIGGEEALERLVSVLKEHDMGLILDIVSNHMAVGGKANPWWLDVLEWGRASPYADFFDIEWQSHDPFMRGQLLVPVLRADYGEVLAAGEISLNYDPQCGRFYAQHFDHHFPISPPGYDEILQHCSAPALQNLAQAFQQLTQVSDIRSAAQQLQQQLSEATRDAAVMRSLQTVLAAFGQDRLHPLLERQDYRLACWRTASDDINWRRFFDINELGGLRVECPEVFEATHQKIFSLIELGWVEGLRVDHVDGLANPRSYCRKLRRICRRLRADVPGKAAAEFPVYVEKILSEFERLPADWLVSGSTGYEFANQVSLIQHSPEGEAPLTALWQEISGRTASFGEEVYQAKKLMLAGTLAGDLETVAQGLLQIARQQVETRDLTLGSIRRALTELIAHFPVYRTYVSGSGRSASDETFFRMAVKGAGEKLSAADWPALESIDQWLGGESLSALAPGPARDLRRHVLSRFQQLTSPSAAKGVEDTAFYRAGVLLSRYDVGFDAQNFSTALDSFHFECRERLREFPHSLLTTATHDTKRGEDMRARLAVLSECAPWYREQLKHWRQLANALRHQTADGIAPEPGDELILYQTLIGSWPLSLSAQDKKGCEGYLARLLGWQQKALREAKLRTSWDDVNPAYESSCADFLTLLMRADDAAELRQSLADTAATLAPAGALNSLTQCLLRLSCPGVPDLYQGTEFWDFSLVDPDNRRPVDYPLRRTALDAGPSHLPALLAGWQDGRIKQRLIQRMLLLRKQYPELFSQGDYTALKVHGKRAGNVLAFLRRHGSTMLLIAVPVRCAALVCGHTQPLPPPDYWQDTVIKCAGAFRDVLSTGRQYHGTSLQGLPAAELFAEFPVSCLLSIPAEETYHEPHQ